MRGEARRAFVICAILLSGTTTASLAGPKSDPPTKRWTLEDFGGVLSVGLEGYRNYQTGLARYRTLCAGCHALGKHGGGNAPDLTRRSLTYTPEELLAQILSPSKHPPSAASERGLLDSLTQAGVLDLLAFVLSGADPQSAFFSTP